MIDDNFLLKVRLTWIQKEDILEWFRKVSTKALENKPIDMTNC